MCWPGFKADLGSCFGGRRAVRGTGFVAGSVRLVLPAPGSQAHAAVPWFPVHPPGACRAMRKAEDIYQQLQRFLGSGPGGLGLPVQVRGVPT